MKRIAVYSLVITIRETVPSTEYEGFCLLCVTLRIIVVLDLSVVRNSKYYKTQRFGNWIYIRPQEMGGKHTLCWVPKKELTSCFLVLGIPDDG
jgi:hypothetical protein